MHGSLSFRGNGMNSASHKRPPQVLCALAGGRAQITFSYAFPSLRVPSGTKNRAVWEDRTNYYKEHDF